MYKRVFLIVLDSLGAGEAPDAAAYGDEGSSTLDALIGSGFLSLSAFAARRPVFPADAAQPASRRHAGQPRGAA